MRLKIRKFILPLLAVILVFNGCRKEIDELVTVRTEDIVYISGEQLVLTGRVVSTGEIIVTEHGFEVSKDESFSSPLLITLGEKSVPGRYFGEIDGLELETQYYVRAFADVNGERLSGNTLPFNTLDIVLGDFSPKVGAANQIITITGINFTNDTKVYFDGVEAEILDITVESVIRVKVPQKRDNIFPKLTIERGDAVFEFDETFEYIIGGWTMLDQFPVNNNFYREVMHIENEDQFLFGLGIVNNNQAPNSETFLFNKNSETWQSYSLPQSAVLSPFSAWPYFGNGAVQRFGGAAESIPTSSGFYEFTGDGFEYLGETPFSLHKAIAFNFKGELYVLGGSESNREFNQVMYKYNPTSREWVGHDAVPINVNSDSPHFQHEDKFYIVGLDKEFYAYDGNEWERLEDVPFGAALAGFNEVIGDRAFIGLSTNSRISWEYDIPNKKWKQKTIFPGNFANATIASWSEGNLIYVMRNKASGASGIIEIWVLDPDAV